METLKVLFKSGIGGRFLASVYGWTVCSMLYFAIVIYSEDFSTDRFINFLLSGVSEFPAYLLGFFLVKFIGRSRTAFILMMLCGISSYVLPFIPKDLSLLSTAIALVGKVAIAGVFYVWYLISCEVIPTLQRSFGVGLCSAGSTIASLFAPYLMYTRKYNYFAANIVLGTAAVLCALAGLFFVPETLGVDVPDTVAEARQNQRFYGLNLCRKFPQEKKGEMNIMQRKDDIELKEPML